MQKSIFFSAMSHRLAFVMKRYCGLHIKFFIAAPHQKMSFGAQIASMSVLPAVVGKDIQRKDKTLPGKTKDAFQQSFHEE